MSCPTDAQAGKSVDSFSCIVHQCALKEHDNLFFILRRPYTLSFVSSPRDDVDECVMLQTKKKCPYIDISDCGLSQIPSFPGLINTQQASTTVRMIKSSLESDYVMFCLWP